MPLSDTHYAGQATAICLLKCRVLNGWAQVFSSPNCSIFRFGPYLEILELELAHLISYTNIFYSYFL